MRRRQGKTRNRVAPEFTHVRSRALSRGFQPVARYNGVEKPGEIAMDDWNGFYTLIGGTAGTLTGLIFVVIALGAKSAQARDADRTRLLVAPILVYFVTLLVVSLAMIPPLAQPTRALALGVIGCAGLFYTINLA
jgi:hypothetical protein